MPITLPQLDNLTWEQLMAEARSLLPALTPDWTNFNASDPGVTLLELFAHFTEQMLYRANRIGDEHTLMFLRLLRGPAWSPKHPLAHEVQSALQELAAPIRAVTAGDFESLAVTEANRSSTLLEPSATAHALCLPDRDLRKTNNSPSLKAPGHISIVLLPAQGREPSPGLLHRVQHALDAARLITTHVHVVAPQFVRFGLRVTLVLDGTMTLDWVRDATMNRLQDFFDPHHGGPDGHGWQFGRPVYLSDLYSLLGRIQGVDHLRSTKDEVTGKESEVLRVPKKDASRLVFNDRGGLVALRLNEDELPALEFKPEDITLEQKAGRR